MDQTLRFLAEDRAEKAERAERIASNSGGSSSREKQSTAGGGGLRKQPLVGVAIGSDGRRGSEVPSGSASRRGSDDPSLGAILGGSSSAGRGSRGSSKRIRSRCRVAPPSNESEWIKLLNAYSTGDSIHLAFPASTSTAVVPGWPKDDVEFSSSFLPTPADTSTVRGNERVVHGEEETDDNADSISPNADVQADVDESQSHSRETADNDGHSPDRARLYEDAPPSNLSSPTSSIESLLSNQDPSIPNVISPSHEPYAIAHPEQSTYARDGSGSSSADKESRLRPATRAERRAHERLARGLGQADSEAFILDSRGSEAEEANGAGKADEDMDTVQPSVVEPGEYDRVKAFYEKNGYLSAPRQSKEATLRRLQAM